jgi:hypothetical protein
MNQVGNEPGWKRTRLETNRLEKNRLARGLRRGVLDTSCRGMTCRRAPSSRHLQPRSGKTSGCGIEPSAWRLVRCKTDARRALSYPSACSNMAPDPSTIAAARLQRHAGRTHLTRNNRARTLNVRPCARHLAFGTLRQRWPHPVDDRYARPMATTLPPIYQPLLLGDALFPRLLGAVLHGPGNAEVVELFSGFDRGGKPPGFQPATGPGFRGVFGVAVLRRNFSPYPTSNRL